MQQSQPEPAPESREPGRSGEPGEPGASRRQVAALSAAALVSGGALAACGGGSVAVPANSAGPSAAASAGEKTAAANSPDDALVKLSDVPVGGSVKIGGTIVTRTGTNRVVGLSTTCTHQGCSVAPKGSQLVCPCHGSRFSSETGAVLRGPAAAPLAKVKLLVKGGYVHLA